MKSTVNRFRLASLLLPSIMLAAFSWPQLCAAEGIPVIDLRGETSTRGDVEFRLGRGPRQTIEPVAPDSLLIDRLRWTSPDPARVGCENGWAQLTERVTVEREGRSIDTPVELFSALLDQAEREILYLELNQALNTVDAARNWISCLDSELPSEQIRRMFLCEALIHCYEEDGEQQAAFEQMLAVAPDLFLEADYGSRIRSVFLAAAEKVSRVEPVRLENDSPYEVIVDGQTLKGRREIRPGNHLFQARGPGGEFRTRLLPVNGPETRVTELTDFGLISGEEALRSLTRSLGSGDVRPWNVALDAFCSSHSPETLLFLGVNEADSLIVLKCSEGKGISVAPEYRVSAVRPSPATQMTVRADVGAHTAWGAGDVYVPNGPAVGYLLHVDVHFREVLMLGVRVSAFPHELAGASSPGDCGASFAGGNASAEAVDAAMTCLPYRTAYSLGVGMGYRVRLSRHMYFNPAVYLDSSFLPDVVVEDASDVMGGIGLVDILAVGPLGLAHLAYELPAGRTRLEVGFAVWGGAAASRISGSTLLTVPMGLSLTLGARYPIAE